MIPRLPEIWDEPFAHASQIPTYLVSRVVREDVTVSLSEDGGDDVAGYNRHTWLDRLWGKAGLRLQAARRSTGGLLGSVPPAVIERASRFLPAGWQVRNPSTKAAKLARVLSASDPEDAYGALTTHWDDASSLVLGVDPDGTADDGRTSALSGGGITELMLWSDLVKYLPNDILPKLDRAAMAVSLETRVPFLDRGILNLAWRLPLDAKLRGGQTKWVLRQVLERHVPAALVERPKMGFGLPIGRWSAARLHLGRRSFWTSDGYGIRASWTRSGSEGPGNNTARDDRTSGTSCGTCSSCSLGSTGGCHQIVRRKQRNQRELHGDSDRAGREAVMPECAGVPAAASPP